MHDKSDQRWEAEPALAESVARKGFLLSLGDRLRATASAEEVRSIATEMLARHLGAARAGYGEIDETGQEIRAQADWSDGVPPLTGGGLRLLRSFGEALADELCAGNTIRVNDSDADPRASGEGVPEAWASIQLRAVIAVPLIRDGRLVAFLYVHEPLPRSWTDAEVQLAQDVAERTWEAAQRARAEAALRKSEERLRQVADAMPALISYVDAGQRFRFVNQLHCEWFGRPLDQIIGHHLREVMSEETYEARRPYLERALAGERVTHEAVIPGEPRRLTVIQHIPHRAEDGQVLGIYSLVQDVTEQKRTEAELRQSRDEFAAVLNAVPAAILIAADPQCRIIRANRQAAEMLRIDPEGSLTRCDPVLPPNHFRVFDAAGRELSREELPVQRAARGEPSFMHEQRILFDDGSTIDLLGNAVPLHSSNGEIRGAVGAFVDIGQRKRAEDALREERSTLEILNRTGDALAAELELERLVQLITDAGVAVTGAKCGAFFYRLADEAGERKTLHALSGSAWSEFERFAQLRATAVFQPPFRGARIARSDDILADPRYAGSQPREGLSARHLPVRSYLAVPVVSRSGEIIGSLLFGHPAARRFSERHERLMAGIAAQAAIAIDNAHLYGKAQQEIEQRKRAEDHQRLLIDELNHRVKNSLAIVQGVAQQTFRNGAEMEEARRAFEGRLAALSAAHNVLTRRNWEHARFSEIVEGALAPFHRPGDGRAVAIGDDLRLQPKTAVSLAMAFHELATNAVKYGAWSNDAGRVVVQWQVVEAEEGPRLHLVWREEGGPPVTRPRRKGFGSRMVERALAAELDGSVVLVFDSAGLRCEFDTPLPPEPHAAGTPPPETQA